MGLPLSSNVHGGGAWAWAKYQVAPATYGHTNIFNVFKMFYLRNQVLVKRAAKQTNAIFNNLQCCPSKYPST